jgi:hypothetical protein
MVHCSRCKKEIVEVELKNPKLAAFLSLLLPGLGRLYTGSLKRLKQQAKGSAEDDEWTIVPLPMGPLVMPQLIPVSSGMSSIGEFVATLFVIYIIWAVALLTLGIIAAFVLLGVCWAYCVWDAYKTAKKINMLYSLSGHMCISIISTTL